MPNVLEPSDHAKLVQRLGALAPSSAPRWGKFTADGMLAHLVQSARMALGDITVPRRGARAFAHFPLKHLVLKVLPFPKGAPTAPELLVRDEAPIEALRAELVELLARVAGGPRSGMGPVHPLFGALTREEWGALVYKHTDHHLRQFGV